LLDLNSLELCWAKKQKPQESCWAKIKGNLIGFNFIGVLLDLNLLDNCWDQKEKRICKSLVGFKIKENLVGFKLKFIGALLGLKKKLHYASSNLLESCRTQIR
jgi:hypothetical protein